MRRGDDVGQAGEFGRRHLVRCPADIHGGAGDATFGQGLRQCRLVDEIAARHVDEEGIGLHAPEGRLAQQVLGLLVGDGEADHVVGARQKIVERQLGEATIVDLGIGIRHQHGHAEPGQQRRQGARDAAVADDADRAAAELATDPDLRSPAGVIVGHGARDAARKIDQQAEREFHDRLHEARLGMGYQHTRPRGRFDIDVADVDGATHHDSQPRQPGEDFARHRGGAVGDDEVDVARRRDHPGGIEGGAALVQRHLDQLLQARECARAIVLPPGQRHVGEKQLQLVSSDSEETIIRYFPPEVIWLAKSIREACAIN